MSRSKKPHVPAYRLHKQSGLGIVTLTDGQGGRRDVLLGKHGSPESLAEYRRVMLEWDANGRRPPLSRAAASTVSLNEVILAYWQHVETYYRLTDGTPSSEV